MAATPPFAFDEQGHDAPQPPVLGRAAEFARPAVLALADAAAFCCALAVAGLAGNFDAAVAACAGGLLAAVMLGFATLGHYRHLRPPQPEGEAVAAGALLAAAGTGVLAFAWPDWDGWAIAIVAWAAFVPAAAVLRGTARAALSRVGRGGRAA